MIHYVFSNIFNSAKQLLNLNQSNSDIIKETITLLSTISNTNQYRKKLSLIVEVTIGKLSYLVDDK